MAKVQSAARHTIPAIALSLALCAGTSLRPQAQTSGLIAQAQSAARELTREVRECVPSQDEPLRVAVLPVARHEDRLTPDQKERALQRAQRAFQHIEGVKVVPVKSVPKLVAFVNDPGRKDNSERIREGIRKYKQADAAILIRFHARTQGAVKLSLKAVITSFECVAVAPLLISDAGPRDESDIQTVLANYARELVPQAEGDLYIPPFESATGRPTDCDGALQNRLIRAVQDAADTPNATIGGHTPRVLAEEHDGFDGMRIVGRFGRLDVTASKPGLWIEIEARAGGVYLKTLTRTRVFGFDCDPSSLGFLEAVVHRARTNQGIMQIFADDAGPFRVGDPFRIKIYASRSGTPYCWYLSEDEQSGYILTPNQAAPETQAIKANTTLSFPTAFGYEQWTYQEPSEDLLHCFLPDHELPEELAERWATHWFGVGGDDAPLRIDSDTIHDLLSRMRAQSDIVEAYRRLIIKPGR